MVPIDIRVQDSRTRFTVGETVPGSVELILPETANVPQVVNISLECVGEVRCSDPPQGKGHIYFGDDTFYEQVLTFSDKDIIQNKVQETHKKVRIPFSFVIPKDKSLPSSFRTPKGFIRWYVLVSVNLDGVIKNHHYDLTVAAPLDQNLQISVGASAEKVVLFHSGTVALQATITRKGWAPGERIPVQVSIDNRINAVVTPRVALQQVQIYMSGHEHKTVETTLSEQLLEHNPIAAHSEASFTAEVTVPPTEWFTIKSSLITVKYFVVVSAVIPHSLELHANLPVVITSQQVVDHIVASK